MTTPELNPVAEAAFGGPASLLRYAEPVVFRGLAADWPAVRTWTFPALALRVPDVRVQAVVGNRETHATHFDEIPVRRYLAALHTADAPGGPVAYLKEFDLLQAVPSLRQDLRHERLLPRRHLGALRAWIGPAQARTGLHRDFLDNIAVQVIGRKRWHLARPGTVQRLGAASTKYDAWAALSRQGLRELAARDSSPGDYFTVDTAPGDALRVPAGWWHEVENLSASLLFGGFHGPAIEVLVRWAWVSGRDWAHRCGWLARGNCTCHP